MSLSNESYHAFPAILKEELVPTLGCNEPIATAYAAAKVHELLGYSLKKLK